MPTFKFYDEIREPLRIHEILGQKKLAMAGRTTKMGIATRKLSIR